MLVNFWGLASKWCHKSAPFSCCPLCYFKLIWPLLWWYYKWVIIAVVWELLESQPLDITWPHQIIIFIMSVVHNCSIDCWLHKIKSVKRHFTEGRGLTISLGELDIFTAVFRFETPFQMYELTMWQLHYFLVVHAPQCFDEVGIFSATFDISSFLLCIAYGNLVEEWTVLV